MSLIVDGTTGVTFNDSSLQGAAASPFGLKNRIINGDMNIWQRANTYTGTPSAVAYGSVDRWAFYSISSITASRSTSVPTGFQYSLRVQRPAAATTTNAIYAFQVVESVNMLDLAGQSVTLSFWAKAGANFSASGNILNVFVNTGTVADQGSATGLGGWTGSASPISTTQAITTTWTRYTFTGTVASNALELDVGMYFTPTGTAGADDAVYITGVQLEIGTSATPFERRLYGQELANCQRYCLKYCGNTLYEDVNCNFIGFNGTTAYGFISTVVPMRSSPSVTSGTIRLTDQTNVISVSSIVASGSSYSGPYNINVGVNVASGGIQYRPYQIQANNSTSAYLILSAEL